MENAELQAERRRTRQISVNYKCQKHFLRLTSSRCIKPEEKGKALQMIEPAYRNFPMWVKVKRQIHMGAVT